VIGVTPAFGLEIHRTTAGHKLVDVIQAIMDGIAEGGGTARLVRILHTADTSFVGLSAAKLSGSGLGIGIQSKGTSVLHKADRLPHMNLELFSNAPLVLIEHYRQLGRNAARHTFGESPEPVVVPFRGEALSARFHARVAILFAIETAMSKPEARPVQLSLGPVK
jgi:propanediol dehydratase large subunit